MDRDYSLGISALFDHLTAVANNPSTSFSTVLIEKALPTAVVQAKYAAGICAGIVILDPLGIDLAGLEFTVTQLTTLICAGFSRMISRPY